MSALFEILGFIQLTLIPLQFLGILFVLVQ